MLRTILNLACLLAWLAAVPLAAQQVLPPVTGPIPTATPATPDPVVLLDRNSPRATLKTFLTAITDARGELPVRMPDHARLLDAVRCLDLSQIDPLARKVRGEDLAWMLLEVLDRTWLVEFDKVPDRATGGPFRRSLERDGIVYGEIEVSRQPDGEWLVDASTLARLPAMLLALKNVPRLEGLSGAGIILPGLWIQEHIPPSLRVQGFILEHWQWLGLLFLVCASYLLHHVVRFVQRILLERWKKYLDIQVEAAKQSSILRPLGLLTVSLLWMVGVRALNLPDTLFVLFLFAARLGALSATTWFVYRFVDLLNIILVERAKKSSNQMDSLLIPLVSRTLRVVVIVTGLILIADFMGFNVTAVVAGLGIGGLALALAAKDTVENFFGSITVVLDRPFKVGDLIKMGDIEGYVEDVGFRSTRIRTLNNSLITVPNAKWANTSVDNFGMRVMRRINVTLGLQYDTRPEHLMAFIVGVRELIVQHPYTRKDNYAVQFSNFGASALEVEINCFLNAPDNPTEQREKERLFMNILKLAAQLHVRFAFPTQTVHVSSWPGALPNALSLPVAPDRKDIPEGSSPEDWGRQAARILAHADCPPGTIPPPAVYPERTQALEAVKA